MSRSNLGGPGLGMIIVATPDTDNVPLSNDIEKKKNNNYNNKSKPHPSIGRYFSFTVWLYSILKSFVLLRETFRNERTDK